MSGFEESRSCESPLVRRERNTLSHRVDAVTGTGDGTTMELCSTAALFNFAQFVKN
jgi:hypothetical protein